RSGRTVFVPSVGSVGSFRGGAASLFLSGANLYYTASGADNRKPRRRCRMHLDQLRNTLASPDGARALLHAWNLRDTERGWRNLSHLASTLPLEALSDLCMPLTRFLPRCPDPDMALNNLERFLANPAAVAQLPALHENRARALEILVQLFGTSQ